MALQPQTVTAGLYGGLDLKTDAKFVTPDHLLTAENLRFTDIKSVRKRYGQTALSQTITAGGMLQTGKALGTFNNELLAYDGTALYGYSQASGAWQKRGNLTETLVGIQNITAGVNSAQNVTSASNGAVEVYVWEDTNGSIYYSARDTVTGTFYAQNALVASGAAPQVIFSGTSVYIFWTSGAVIYFNSILLANLGGGLQGTGTLTLSLLPGTYPGVAASADPANPGILVAFATSTSNMVVNKYTTGMAFQAGQTISFASAAGAKFSVSPNTVADTVSGGPYYVVGAIKALPAASGALGQVFAINIANTTASGPISVVALATGYTVNNFVVNVFNGKIVYVGDASGTGKPFIFSGTGTVTSGTCSLVANTNFLYGLGVASQIGVRPEGAYWVAASPVLNIAGKPSQQIAYYLCGITLTAPSPTILSRYLGSQAITFAGNPPQVSLTASSQLFLGQPYRAQLRADASGTIYSVVYVTSATFTFPATSGVQVVLFNGTALINCGITYDYDGISLVENGFWEFPDGLSATTGFPDNSPIPAFLYEYNVTYEWTNALGNVTLSAPSYSLSVGCSQAVGPANPITLTIPYTALTAKQGVNVCVYRTIANSSSPGYKVFSVPNQPTSVAAAFTLTDGLSDAQASGLQKLYAPQDFSAEIDNEPAPPFKYMFATKTRVFGIPQDYPYQLWYSKPAGGAIAPQPRAPEFVLGQFLPIETQGGAVTGLAALDTQAVVFKAERIYFLPGNGPNAGGIGNDFPSSLQLVSTTTGCISAPSILFTSDGLYFQSKIGISQLNRGLTSSPVMGFPVQPLVQGLTITGVQSVAAQSQFRWTSSQGTAVVFDYAVGRWSTYTNYDCVGYVSWNGTTARLKTSGQVLFEDTTTFTDNGLNVVMKVETPWLKLGQMAQGYGAIWYMELLGDFKSTHTLGIEAAYDYLDVPAQTAVFNPALTGNDTYGSDSPYGIGSPYGLGTTAGAVYTALYQPRLSLIRQTCQSVKFKFYDISGAGASCTLGEIALQLGVIGGLNRVPTKQQI